MSRHSRSHTRSGFDSYSRTNASTYHERSARKSRHRGVFHGVVVAAVSVLVVGVVALGAWGVSVQMRLSSDTITDDLRSTLVSTTPGQPYYVLLLGTDGRPGETDYRSDTIILARIDPATKKVALVSIPRDTKVTYNGETCKINATYAYGGAQGVVEAVDDLCGVKISHYVEVSFDGFSNVVDAMGGVTLDVPDRIDDAKAGEDVIETGTQTLNGSQALTFCRSRAYADGDYTRMRHQRLFMTAMLGQLEAEANPVTLISVVNATTDMVSTDMTVADIAGLALSLKGIDTSTDVSSANIPSTTSTIDGVSYVIADPDELALMMQRIDAGEDPQGPDTMDEGLDGTTL
ncbi:MAG: LCP family protein [Atopobiaceae bacterium]|nr:LCP family protein [Atopobiaceae bacterium]MCH4214707.1 LCP family protein [Atopobiaceae bacterium]MCH4229887.1 LCP family protein [Atopobiaceae bacterium]MCH4276753.1 LCP family protein [Atopobiaceae bacterium]MCI1226599.1 LCP family protein [Atopobiaceae bacterium]